ncbi:MAG: hypothetical protein A4E53_00183 [Pelotomaculum sp. PtaB.Bin104]|nr:MAG: hypothetical protein A4E53_00183 [Pelotomaculum sp. PtaB.Bin104]
MAKEQLGAESQRAEQIDKIRDLTVLGVNRRITSRSELSQLAIVERILIRKDGRPHDYTSVYRYLDALHFLALDISEKYDYKQGAIEWSSNAVELARLGSNYFRSQSLSQPEKVILREQIFLSKAREQFLATFCPGDAIFDSQQGFLKLAFPLYITELSAKRPQNSSKVEKWPAETCIRITPDIGTKGALKPKKEFLYTYRYWCLDTDIIDELNIREAKRYNIPQPESYVLYPVENIGEIKPIDFLDLLYSALGYKLTRPQAFPVPWLMYRICPQAKLSVEDFKTSLINACRENRDILHLERGPGGLLKGVDVAHNNEFGERYGNHRYYPVINGTIRTNLIVFPVSR